MATHEVSPEVERMRRVVSGLKNNRTIGESLVTTSACPWHMTSNAVFHTDTVASAEDAEATDKLEESTGIVAWITDKEDVHYDIAGSCRSRAQISWQDTDCASSVISTLTVPKRVGRAFGIKQRKFASYKVLVEYLDKLEAECAFVQIECCVQRREYCTFDIRNKLQNDGYAEQAIRSSLTRAQRCGLVDDARYTEIFVANKIRAGWGRVRISHALNQKGISSDMYNECESRLLDTNDAELTRALELLARRSFPQKNAVAKLASYLARKGFSFDICFKASQQYCKQLEDGQSPIEA